jgi:hypothetical protein
MLSTKQVHRSLGTYTDTPISIFMAAATIPYATAAGVIAYKLLASQNTAVGLAFALIAVEFTALSGKSLLNYEDIRPVTLQMTHKLWNALPAFFKQKVD